MKDLVDWETAVRLATLAAPAGPRATGASRRAVVALLRRSALDAPAWVGEITGLRKAAETAAATTDVLVVDRGGWIRSNADTLAALLEPVPVPDVRTSSLWSSAPSVGRRAAATQVGAALGFLATHVIGQVDPLPTPQGRHRLLLVAPNVLATERALELDVLDFPAWVTLHETTHAVQLAAAPWLADHLAAELRALIASVAARDAATGGLTRLLRMADGVRGAVRNGTDLLPTLLDEEEAERLAGLIRLTTVLEGHAEAVLDAVTPARMPPVYRLRATMTRSRRAGAGGVGGVDALLHRLSGLDAKLGQYTSGARFVRAVVGLVGHEGLNAVWSGPEQLPTAAELARPEAWVARVHGRAGGVGRRRPS